MSRQDLHSINLEADENGVPLLETALKTPSVGTELGVLVLTGHAQRLGLAPVETDPSNRLAHYEQILGLGAVDRTVYFSTVDDGASTGHVLIYSDAARTALIGHTAAAAVGHQAVVADNASGLGGYVELTSIGNSANISVALVLSRPVKNVFVKPQTVAVGGGVNAASVVVGYSATPSAYEIAPADKGYLIEFSDACGLYVLGTAADKVYVTVKA
jgi:hypothetical protein